MQPIAFSRSQWSRDTPPAPRPHPSIPKMAFGSGGCFHSESTHRRHRQQQVVAHSFDSVSWELVGDVFWRGWHAETLMGFQINAQSPSYDLWRGCCFCTHLRDWANRLTGVCFGWWWRCTPRLWETIFTGKKSYDAELYLRSANHWMREELVSYRNDSFLYKSYK